MCSLISTQFIYCCIYTHMFIYVRLPVSEAYCEKTLLGVGPSMMKTSMMPLSEIQRTSVCGTSLEPWTKSSILPNIVCNQTHIVFHYSQCIVSLAWVWRSTQLWCLTTVLEVMSTQVSAAFNQKIPMVRWALWDMRMGTEPYRAMGLCSSYWNTSRL